MVFIELLSLNVASAISLDSQHKGQSFFMVDQVFVQDVPGLAKLVQVLKSILHWL